MAAGFLLFFYNTAIGRAKAVSNRTNQYGKATRITTAVTFWHRRN